MDWTKIKGLEDAIVTASRRGRLKAKDRDMGSQKSVDHESIKTGSGRSHVRVTNPTLMIAYPEAGPIAKAREVTV
jgi:hypothetical protein